MKPQRTLGSTLVLAAGLAAGALWSTDSRACADQPFVSALCIMPVAAPVPGYVPADGSLQQVSQSPDLFSLLGAVYGGDGTTTFALPDLRGRVAIGAGTADYGQVFNVGDKPGSYTLTAAQLPAHSHAVTPAHTTVLWSAGGLSGSTSLAGLTATLGLGGVSGSVDGSKLTLKAASGMLGTNAPGGNALGTALPGTKFYATGAPDTAMNAASIGGTAPVRISGTVSVALSGGSASTTLAGAPVLTVAGSTDAAGNSDALNAGNNLQPYLALNYLIAVMGIYPPMPNNN